MIRLVQSVYKMINGDEDYFAGWKFGGWMVVGKK